MSAFSSVWERSSSFGLGDLTWNYELETACPVNLFGEIDLYQVTHHGLRTSVAPAHGPAIRPLVAVVNDAPRKGVRPVSSRH